MNKNNPHGTILILMAAILWGTTGTSQALAPSGAHPLTIGALRLAVGGGALLLIALLRGQITRDCFRQPGITLLAGLLVATYQISFFAAVKSTGVAVGTMVAIGSGPLFAGLLSLIIHGLRPDGRWLTATAAAVSGLLILFIPTTGDVTQLQPNGILLALTAGASYAGYALAIKHLLPGRSSEAVIALVFTVGGILLMPFTFSADLSWAFKPGGLVVILHLGLITTAVAYWLFARGLRTVPALHAVTLSLAEPVTATVLGIFILKEQLTLSAAVGISLVLAGLVILGTQRDRHIAN